MRTQHVPAALWRRTLDDLSRAYDGAIVSLEILRNDVGAQPEVLDQPLRGVSSDRGGVTIPNRKTGRDSSRASRRLPDGSSHGRVR